MPVIFFSKLKNIANSQQISNIAENSYRTEGSGANAPTAKRSEFSYDANGNLIYTATGTVKDTKLQATKTRKLLWDEENRLLGISDNGFVSQYWYDAAGERTVKESFDNEGVYVNGALSGARTGTSKFTAYVSPYLVVSQGGNYTKHVYMGSQRITSKVSNSVIFTTSPVKDTLQAKLIAQTTKIKERFDSLGVKYSGVQQTGGLVSASPATTADSYFYHPDHLGSSSLITNKDGYLVQHIQYVPFGEVFVEERNATWSTPYKFNGKEQDEETGLCYYGARYYDPRTSVWLSVDPLAEKYVGWSSYNYTFNNPVRYVDPDGRGPISGGLLGAFTEFAGIAGSKMLFENQSFIEASTLNWGEVGQISIAAAKGAATGIIDGGILKFAKWAAKPTNQKIIVKLLEVGVEALENVLKDFVDDQNIDLKGLLISTLTDVGLGELLNTKKIGKIADDFSNNSKISSNRADDLAKRANPNKKLVEKAKSQAKSDKQASIAFKSVEAVAETTNNIGSDGSKKLVKEDVK